jgi:hypothetical protein
MAYPSERVGAVQYVGTGVSLVAFVGAAILFTYRARLAVRAEIIRSAPERERLEAIAIAAEAPPLHRVFRYEEFDARLEKAAPTSAR